MRTLTSLELNQTNGGLALDQTYVKENILKPLASGAVAGLAIGYMFVGSANLGKYALAYGVGAVAYKIGYSIISDVV